MTETPTTSEAVDGKAAACCKAVTKTYGKGDSAVKALHGVDLSVNSGELMMLVGPSGCGKTSLISVIAGVLDRDGGQCTQVIYAFDPAKLPVFVGQQAEVYIEDSAPSP